MTLAGRLIHCRAEIGRAEWGPEGSAVVAAALAAHPGGRDPVLVRDRAHDAGRRRARTALHRAGWGPAEDGELEFAGAAAVVATPAEVPTVLGKSAEPTVVPHDGPNPLVKEIGPCTP